MKQFFYLILLAVGFSSIHSCKDMVDEEGNPLIDLNQNTGLNGKRALFREITSAGITAEYQYTGLNLSKVINPENSITDIMWSGDKISQINFHGHFDNDGDAVIDDDSITYTRLFTYGNQGRLSLITETRNIFTRTPATGTTPAGPYALTERRKAEYNIKYNAVSSKIDSILMKSGKEIAGTPFAYDMYTKTGYSYNGDNVAAVNKRIGTITGGVEDAFHQHYGYEFSNYDSSISPYSLLPLAYKVSALSNTPYNDMNSLILSPNSPRRKSVTDLMVPIPAPVLFSTNFDYDDQTYTTKGYGIYYYYKPF